MGVQGNLRDMTLTGLISIICNEGHQARLELRQGDQEAYVYFNEGQIQHMTLGEREGEEVIGELLSWTEGTFELEMNVAPPAHTVHTPWTSLVLESMRVLDESTTTDEEFREAEVNDISIFEEEDKMADLKELLKEMSAEIPGFEAAAVSGMDGLSIGEYTSNPDFDLEIAAAQFALVMKLVSKNAGRLNSGVLEDNLVTTDKSYILSRTLGEGDYYVVVAVDRDMASLGNVRLMVRNFAPDLWDAVPKRSRR